MCVSTKRAMSLWLIDDPEKVVFQNGLPGVFHISLIFSIVPARLQGIVFVATR